MRTIICATIAVLLVGTAGAQDFFGIPGFPDSHHNHLHRRADQG